jgi:MFS family permease
MTAVHDEPTSTRNPLPRSTSTRWPYVRKPVGFVGISAAMVAVLVAAGAPTPLLPIYQARWGFPAWQLTLAFGVYAFSLLVAILVIGSLSDHIGRRPLMIAALALNLAAMLVFLFSASIDWLIAARIVQGIATGAASSALSAAVVELAPQHRKKLGALMTSLAPLAGLGIGALFSGLLAQFASDAAFEVWLALTAVMALGTLFALVTPETATRKPGALASLRPRVSLPVQVRRPYLSALPGIAGSFMMMTLFMGLVPVVLVTVFDVHNPLVGALAAFAAFAAGTAAAGLTSAVRPPHLRTLGVSALATGSILFIATIGAHALPLLWAAALLCGLGVGASFSGTTRGLVPEVEPHERAGLFTAIYLAGYLAMGLSAVVAGLVAGVVGVTAMAIGFGAVMAVTALLGVITTTSARKGK